MDCLDNPSTSKPVGPGFEPCLGQSANLAGAPKPLCLSGLYMQTRRQVEDTTLPTAAARCAVTSTCNMALFYINDTRHEVRAGSSPDDLACSLNDYIRLRTRFKVS